MGWVASVWCWDSVGRAVDIPIQSYSTYPHPVFIQHQVFPHLPRPHTHRSPHPLSPPSPNSHPPYLPYIHPTELHSSANSTPTNLTRLSTIFTTLHTLSHPETRPTLSQPDPLQHRNPTHLSHHTRSAWYRTVQTLIPPTP